MGVEIGEVDISLEVASPKSKEETSGIKNKSEPDCHQVERPNYLLSAAKNSGIKIIPQQINPNPIAIGSNIRNYLLSPAKNPK